MNIICKKCKIEKNSNEFSASVRSNNGRNIYCRTCHGKMLQKTHDTVYGRLKRLYDSSKLHAKHRTIKSSDVRGMNTITLNDIVELWNNQRGRCYYSGIKLNHVRFSNWCVSLERLDPMIGYTIDNIALVAQEFNGSTQWNKNKIKDIGSLLKTNSDDISLFKVRFKRMLNKARSRGKEFDLTDTHLSDLFIKQGGRCAYSNIPLRTTGDWKISLERIDVHKGYVNDNVAFICAEFNTPDRTIMHKEYKIYGRGCGWSRSKFLYFIERLIDDDDEFVNLKLKKIMQYDLDMNYIKTWNSMKNIKEELNILETSISNCISGKSKTAGKFIWKCV